MLTTEADIISFYSKISDNLAIVARTMTIKSDRFPGFSEYLSLIYVYQSVMMPQLRCVFNVQFFKYLQYLNWKKYAMVGRKLARESLC